MTTLYVVTHPEATHHVDGLVGGWFDSDLTDRGRAHAERIAVRLRAAVPTGASVSVHSSDLVRTMQTAEPIGRMLGVNVVAVPDLREKSYGVAEGRPQTWLDERFVFPPAEGERLDHDEGIEGAETKRDWVERVYRAGARIEADAAEHRIVVTHGGSQNWVIASWLRLPVGAASHAAFRAPAGSISVLTDDGPFHNRTLQLLGDVAHLG